MALTVWTQPSGSLGTFQEGLPINNLQLPIANDAGVTYTKISGDLPAGLWLSNHNIKGTPFEVVRDKIFTFCIRASLNGQISDRTFSITIAGPDNPVIITPPGLLDIGLYKQLYVVDDSFVNYQIEAYDSDTIAGQSLTYFITEGTLPPGLSLSPTGVIYGVVDSVTTLQPAEGNGSFDHGYYDSGPYDFASPQLQNGYDNLQYDYLGFDYYAVTQPKSLNRFYEFVVSVTDGETLLPPSQSFQIYVVNPDTFRADSEALVSNAKWFNADVSYLQAPVWLTPSDLGTYRANNYITLVLDVFDTTAVYYEIDNIANLPPNMNIDLVTGEIFGRVPAQPATTKTYSFTVTASRYGDATTSETAHSSKSFTVKIIGEIDSVISWITPSNLGHINVGTISTLNIVAMSSITNANISYRITNGVLPPGLTLSQDGEILGKVSQYSNQVNFDNKSTTFDSDQSQFRVTFDDNTTIFDDNSTKIGYSPYVTTFNKSNVKSGIISFDLTPTSKTTFDNGTTTIDRIYKFTVEAYDESYFSAVSRTFSITIDVLHYNLYSNIYVKPYMTPSHRAVWSKFINNPAIFTPDSLYRQNDPEFGLQPELNMLIYAGIETKQISAYTELLNESVKRFHFGDLQKAIAYNPGTTTPVYEVLYANMIDPLLEDTLYANDNVTMWRSQIEKIGESNWLHLPLWMRSIQPSYRKQLGFVLGVPVCFCKSGTADTILLNIKHYNFDFKLLDYTVDRFIINQITGYDADKYIIFNNRNHV